MADLSKLPFTVTSLAGARIANLEHDGVGSTILLTAAQAAFELIQGNIVRSGTPVPPVEPVPAVASIDRLSALRGGQPYDFTVEELRDFLFAVLRPGTVLDVLAELRGDADTRHDTFAKISALLDGLQMAVSTKATPADIAAAVAPLTEGSPAEYDTFREAFERWRAGDTAVTALAGVVAKKADLGEDGTMRLTQVPADALAAPGNAVGDAIKARTLPADVKKFLADMLGLDAALPLLLAAGIVVSAQGHLARSMAEWVDDVPITVSAARKALATVLDAGPWVAVQRALDRSLRIEFDDFYDYGNAASFRLRDGHHIYGRAASKCGMKRSSVGEVADAYQKPFFDFRDVKGVLIEQFFAEMTIQVLPEYFAILRSNAYGNTDGITFRNVSTLRAPTHVERWVRNFSWDGGEIDGGGTVVNNPDGTQTINTARTGAVGISFGGYIASSTDPLRPGQGTVSPDGRVDGLYLRNLVIHGVRSEGLDPNWDTHFLHAENIEIYDYSLAGAEEAIDIGGGDGDAACSDHTYRNIRIRNTIRGRAISGFHVKLGSKRITLADYDIQSVGVTDADGTGIVIEHGAELVVGRGRTVGWRTGIAGATGNVTLDGLEVVGAGIAGANFGNLARLRVLSLKLVGTAASAGTATALIVAGCTDFALTGVEITGTWNRAYNLTSTSTGMVSGFVNTAVTNLAPIDAFVRATFPLPCPEAFGALALTGGALGGPLTVNGSAFVARSDDTANGAQIIGRKAGGTLTAPTAILQNYQLLAISGQGYTGSGYLTSAQIIASVIAPTPSSTDMQSRFNILLCPAGSTALSTALFIDHAAGLALFGSTVIDANRLVRLRVYTVATLPTAGIAGRTAYASNGRAFSGAGAQEAAGGGTGVIVNDNGAAWKVAGTNATVAA